MTISASLKAVALLAFGATAFAQDITSMPEVIVTARRLPESPAEVPHSAVVLRQEDLTRQGARSLPDALKYTPGVLVQKTSPGQGSPFIRGFTGFRTLAMIDGIRLNNSVFREGPNQYWNTIDTMSLEAIELTKGQGSVLYGSDAIGGTMNARTRGARYEPAPTIPVAPSGKTASGKTLGSKNPEQAASADINDESPVTTGGALRGRYASGERSWQSRIEGYVSQEENFGLFLGATYKDFGDLRAADLGILPKTGYEEIDFDGKFEWWLEENLKFTLAHQQVHQENVWRTHRTNFSKPWQGTARGTEQAHVFDQDRYLSYARIEGSDGTGLVTGFQFTLSHHRQSEDRFRIRAIGDDRRDEEGFRVDTYGATLQLESDSPVGRLAYGADYYLDVVDSYQRRFNPDGSFSGAGIQGPVADNANYHLAGVFVQDIITLGDRTEVTVGGRFNYARAEADRVADPLDSSNVGSLSDDWTNVIGSARVSYALEAERKSLVYAGISQGFRAPNLSDLTRLDIARTNELETPSPGLEPEKFISYDVGVKGAFDRFSGELSLFYTDITDMIVRQPTGTIIDGATEVRKRNAGDGYIYGVEAALAWEFVPQWTLFANFSWQDGRVDGYPTSAPEQVEEPISRLLPSTSLVGLRWTSASERFWFEGAVQIVDHADRLSAGDRSDTQRIPPGGTPSYTMASLRGGWRINEHLTLNAGLENIFDQDYRIHGSGQNEPGLNAIVGFDLTF